MPSLRRTLSSPSVRSSPYRNPSSSALGHATRAGNPQPRRSSGSDTSNRRVLADIDWWVVQDGQREFVAPSGQDEDANEVVAAENEQVRPLGGATVVTSEDIVEAPPAAAADVAIATGGHENEILSSPLWDVSTDSSFGFSTPEVMSPLPHFASLSVAPRAPLRRHASESSQSSLDSSFESAPGSPFLPTYMDILQPAVPAYPSVFASSIGARRPAGRVPPLASRSVSYSAVEFQLSSTRFSDNRFDDMVPTPPPFFSTTMSDCEMDDLFY
ncbi:hypothetical protein DICSQDRAFT_177462 [Dichomitus squalens LYAD-421 SS1]|uniref:Uncharacterized protein n=1 Tax=Dichomitus squalens TaxID=114155 RepID=A0A4Q9N648_9APHY|nr:uncharacterized protein DICSQDRAFT_177462 [Dichomitus squalens LYAD-421 SS1]EJF66089.1 hypothetical protein DICSQDRAFT_177462 [Dichomitus squalens LYAD-421 SS1]TBU35715.1 hypothetical protein BD311DRAFT_11877 [Dichomitus squalens]